jgi:hypothetical protein
MTRPSPATETLQLQVRWSSSFALTAAVGGLMAGAALLVRPVPPELHIPLHLAAIGLAFRSVDLALRRAWPRNHQLKMDQGGFELRRGTRLDSAPWGSISSIEPHKRRGRYDFPGVELKVRGPSGVEHVWIDLWDIYATPRDELAARLSSWRAQGGGPATALPDRLAEHVVSRDIRAMTYGALAVPAGILAVMLLVLFTRS